MEENEKHLHRQINRMATEHNRGLKGCPSPRGVKFLDPHASTDSYISSVELDDNGKTVAFTVTTSVEIPGAKAFLDYMVNNFRRSITPGKLDEESNMQEYIVDPPLDLLNFIF